LIGFDGCFLTSFLNLPFQSACWLQASGLFIWITQQPLIQALTIPIMRTTLAITLIIHLETPFLAIKKATILRLLKFLPSFLF
jgi:hypothetical protein